MTSYSLPRVLLNNVVRSRRQYFGYLSASALAVATFFTFGFFLFHPMLQSQLNGDVSSALSQLLIIGQIGVGLFAVFFIIFFHRFLLRLRGKEFGLLLTFGVTPRLLQKMVWIESLALAVAAILVGLVLGFFETLALFHIIATPLNIPSLEPQFSMNAILYGISFFVVLFGVDVHASARHLRRLTPKAFLTVPKSGQGRVTVSLPKLTAGVACIMAGYILALSFQGASASLHTAAMLPIIILVSVGTYLLFSQCLVGVLVRIRRKTASGLVLISTSRLSHRARDFARVLTLVTLLHAGVLTLVGAALAIFSHLYQLATSPAELEIYLQLFSIVLFVFFFLAFLFFVAAISTLVVKLFTQLDEDRQQFKSLERIGFSTKETRSILSREFAVLFFVPALVAVIHAAVALGEFTTKIAPKELSQHEAWLYFAYVCVAYLICMSGCFIVARWSYGRALRSRQ